MSRKILTEKEIRLAKEFLPQYDFEEGIISSYVELGRHCKSLEVKVKGRGNILFMICNVLNEERKKKISQEEALNRIREHMFLLNMEPVEDE